LLLLNTLLPFRFAYSKYCGKTDENLLFEWAAKTPAESNQFIHSFNELGVPVLNAMSSQALLHLFNNTAALKNAFLVKWVLN